MNPKNNEIAVRDERRGERGYAMQTSQAGVGIGTPVFCPHENLRIRLTSKCQLTWQSRQWDEFIDSHNQRPKSLSAEKERHPREEDCISGIPPLRPSAREASSPVTRKRHEKGGRCYPGSA